eukprot:CAMPEP_0202923018 /NCGR_PEP_ID=MMETSP1392-20130828/78228_1 /ASSEMBLY_ACC=CAM_ASM_000868 /TAXON_ID=225041 /ORGANISM="Chlamydomonas chlamydogama, Strain SAG 11-48b" /LENGTH=451 /DNA_ID=CAMNT_0049616679 /DNA_START=76 /DNA_END=1431 /DNA_ORIENTATION=-
MTSSQFKGCDAPLPKQVKVLGMGSCGVDYLASVAAYPKPDDKLRTETLEAQGGGNCANALTAASRLGLSPVIVTKIGGDGLGDGIITELQEDGVDTSHIMRAAGHPSPFTYIIVDRSGGTRTCIHTPGAALVPEEMGGPADLDRLLEGAALVYFDGRLTEAALLLAARAREQGVPVLVEAERLRPGLEALLQLADYVVTSAHFPQDWTGERELADALVVTAQRLPSARFVITTLGTRGSIMLERPAKDTAAASSVPLATLMSQLQAQLQAAGPSAVVDCVSKNGLEIRSGAVATAPGGPFHLTCSSSRDAAAASQQAAEAAERAAALNADSGAGSRYAGSATSAPTTTSAPLVVHVTMASIASLPAGAVVDTTGAGDAFIGSVLYGLAVGLPRPDMLKLAAVVAACKCTALGARPGLPTRGQLSADLLHGKQQQQQHGVAQGAQVGASASA